MELTNTPNTPLWVAIRSLIGQQYECMVENNETYGAPISSRKLDALTDVIIDGGYGILEDIMVGLTNTIRENMEIIKPTHIIREVSPDGSVHYYDAYSEEDILDVIDEISYKWGLSLSDDNHVELLDKVITICTVDGRSSVDMRSLIG